MLEENIEFMVFSGECELIMVERFLNADALGVDID